MNPLDGKNAVVVGDLQIWDELLEDVDQTMSMQG
jgi:hypothetical protein